MKLVIDGKIYDPTESIILIEFSKLDLENIRNMPEDARRYMLAPHGTGTEHMQGLMERWREVLALYDQKLTAQYEMFIYEHEIDRLEIQIAQLRKQTKEEN